MTSAPAPHFRFTVTARSGKVRSIQRLRQLERLVGPSPAIEECCAHLEARVRLRCPRCDISLTFHQSPAALLCHYCLYERRPPAACKRRA